MQPYLDEFVTILDRLKEIHSESGKFSNPELPEEDNDFVEQDLDTLLEYFPKLQNYMYYTEVPPLRIVDENLHDAILAYIRLYNILKTTRKEYYARHKDEYDKLIERMDFLAAELESVDKLYR